MAILVVFLIFVGIAVSRVKYEVVFLRKQLRSTEKEIQETTDNIRVLNAEWSCLNDPVRIKNLCKKYLPDMKPVVTNQIIEYKEIERGDFVGYTREVEQEKTSKNRGRGLKKQRSDMDFLLDQALENKRGRKMLGGSKVVSK